MPSPRDEFISASRPPPCGPGDEPARVAELIGAARRDIADPIERIFGLLGRYRQAVVEPGCRDGGGGSTVGDLRVRECRAASLRAWTDAVLECLFQADRRFPDTLDRLSLAEFVVTTMTGASLQAQVYRDIACFDRAVRELRSYIELLLYGRPSLSMPIRQALAGLARN